MLSRSAHRNGNAHKGRAYVISLIPSFLAARLWLQLARLPRSTHDRFSRAPWCVYAVEQKMSPKNDQPSVSMAGAQTQPRPRENEDGMKETQQHLRLLVSSVASPPRLVDLLPEYEDYLIGEQRRPQGRARYLWALKRFFVWLGEDATHAELTAASVRRYKEELGKRGCAGSTVINALATIRDFSIWAIWEGHRIDDPTTGIKRPPKRTPLPNPLYPDEVDLVLAAIEQERPPEGSRERWYWDRNRLCVLLFLYTGLRLSEIAALRRSDVRLRADLILVRSEAAKNGEERTVPIAAPLRNELQAAFACRQKESAYVIAQANGQKLSPGGLAHIIDRWLTARLDAYATATGEEIAIHLYPHRFRHTHASHLVWNDADLRTVQEVLGHKQLETTARYTKTDERRKRAAIGKLPDYVTSARRLVQEGRNISGPYE